MNSINSIAGSALQAYNVSLQTTARNVANLNSESVTASRTTFRENGAGGVAASVTQTEDTVSISREAANLISDRNGFKANLTILKVADEMTRELLDIRA